MTSWLQCVPARVTVYGTSAYAVTKRRKQYERMQYSSVGICNFTVHYAHDNLDLLGRNMRAHRFSE